MTTGPLALDPVVRPPSRMALFTAFLKIGVLGFGGVAAFARHVIVVERGFMDDRDFAEAFGMASTVPGANTVNLATMLGDRYAGASGAFVAVAGLMGVPLVILVGVAALYARFSYLPDVRAALLGAATAAAGLTMGTALKLLRNLDVTVVTMLTAVGVCLAAAVLQAPMPLILLVAVPLTLGLAFWRGRHARTDPAGLS